MREKLLTAEVQKGTASCGAYAPLQYHVVGKRRIPAHHHPLVGTVTTGLPATRPPFPQAKFNAELANYGNLERTGKYAEARTVYERLVARRMAEQP